MYFVSTFVHTQRLRWS